MNIEKKSRRVAVVVLGMHRSGTSALTRILGFLGCDMPENLVGAGPGNETGHWEPATVLAANERILASSGSYVHDWLPISKEWAESPKFPAFVTEAAAALRTDFKDSRLFVLKDPRICRLFPFWKSVLEAEGVSPVVICPIRSPIEVAESLSKRDGFDVSWGHLVWLRNVLEAERDSRGVPRFFATYDQLLDNWAKVSVASQAALGVKWPVSLDKADPNVERFLQKRQRHHVTDPSNVLDNPVLSPWLKDVYRVMLKWSDSGEQESDWQVLDRVHDEMALAEPAFGRAVAAGWGAALWGRQLDQRQAETRTEIENTRQALSRAEKSNERLTARVAELESLAAAAQDRAQAVRGEHDRALGEIAQLTILVRQAEERLSARFREIVKLTEMAQRAEEDRHAAAHANQLMEKYRSEAKGLQAAVDALTTEKIELRIQATERDHRSVEAVIGWDGWSLMPDRLRSRLKRALLSRLGLFDGEFYRDFYPDVAAAGLDPLTHYVRYGAVEGRYWSRAIATLAADKAALADTRARGVQ